MKKEFIPPDLSIPISSLCLMKGRVSDWNNGAVSVEADEGYSKRLHC